MTESTIEPSQQYLAFIKQQAAAMRGKDIPPATLAEWETLRRDLRAKLEAAWGGFPREHCPLEPRIVGELKRDGYRVEKIVLQTRPGILMTANAYVPDGDGKQPTVLCVHGHWKGAKQDPVVQSRCIGLAKLGFFVLVVDAFGAGERGLGKALGEYHGAMVASTLWPTGLALAGLQVYENMRAVDYLQTRPEVDATRIGVTGASGGGNQTMYAGAFDERFKAVVPTCSVGTYQAYLGAACCMCELTPNVLTFAEEWALLAMAAPRALMVINATEDAFQFSPGEAKKSIAAARVVFDLVGRPNNIRHTIFESKHDYSRPMREAMYGWMTLHLKGEGDGEPIAEPAFETEDPETLRCFPGDSRPEDFVTLPQFAAAEARGVLARRPVPQHQEHWDAEAMSMLQSLAGSVLGSFPARTPLQPQVVVDPDTKARTISIESEPGITITAVHKPAKGRRDALAIVLHGDGMAKANEAELAKLLESNGWDIVTADLRAIGRYAPPNDKIVDVFDHNSAQWAMLVGRPLLGQWAFDVSRLLDGFEATGEALPSRVVLVGIGPLGILAIVAGALDRRVTAVAAIDTLATLVAEKPYTHERIGVLPPGILRKVGDVAHLAALVAPKRLIVAGGTSGTGKPLDVGQLEEQYAYARAAFRLEGTPQQLTLLAAGDAKRVVEALSAEK